ncbi:MAG: hypothetical protein ACOZBL_00945 [Patescibacteria group bacterium]
MFDGSIHTKGMIDQEVTHSDILLYSTIISSFAKQNITPDSHCIYS